MDSSKAFAGFSNFEPSVAAPAPAPAQTANDFVAFDDEPLPPVPAAQSRSSLASVFESVPSVPAPAPAPAAAVDLFGGGDLLVPSQPSSSFPASQSQKPAPSGVDLLSMDSLTINTNVTPQSSGRKWLGEADLFGLSSVSTANPAFGVTPTLQPQPAMNNPSATAGAAAASGPRPVMLNNNDPFAAVGGPMQMPIGPGMNMGMNNPNMSGRGGMYGNMGTPMGSMGSGGSGMSTPIGSGYGSGLSTPIGAGGGGMGMGMGGPMSGGRPPYNASNGGNGFSATQPQQSSMQINRGISSSR